MHKLDMYICLYLMEGTKLCMALKQSSACSIDTHNIQIGKGGGGESPPLYTQPDHIRTCFVYGGGVMPGRQAGGLVQCREPKTGQQKVQLSSKTEQFAHLGVLFIYDLEGDVGQYQ